MKTDLVETDNDGIPQIEPQYFLLDCELTEQEIMEQSPAIWDYLQSGIEKTVKNIFARAERNGNGKNKGMQPISCVLTWAEGKTTVHLFALFLIFLKRLLLIRT